MLRWIVILMLAAMQVPAWASSPGEAPFWRKKEKVYARIQNREVIVSVKSLKAAAAGKNHLKIQGGGHVHAPRDFVFAQAQRYEDLMKSSSYVKSAKYDPEKGEMSFAIAAFGYKGNFRSKVRAYSEGDKRKIEYEIMEGLMRGLIGRFDFADVGTKKTEVGIDGDFSYEKFPLAKMFLEFGMEVVFQRMAINMRSQVEDEFKKSQEQREAKL